MPSNEEEKRTRMTAKRGAHRNQGGRNKQSGDSSIDKRRQGKSIKEKNKTKRLNQSEGRVHDSMV